MQKKLAWSVRERLRAKFCVEFVEEEIPVKPRKKTLYIVTEDNVPWSAAMVCPCGCGAILHLNLLPDEHPMWRLVWNADKSVSLIPSILRQVGCHSHFWIRQSRVYWTADQPKALFRDLRLLFSIR